MTIGGVQTVMGLLNGMIGGTILILPLVGQTVGYMSVLFITLFLGAISGYTAFLILKHLGKAPTINEAIQDHFGGDKRYSIAYNVFISFTFTPWICTYFHLLVLQIKGLTDIDSWILPLVIFILLIFLTIFLKSFELGQKFLAYGIMSIIAYIFFLTWAQITAPSGEKKVTPFGSQYSNYMAILMGALAVHDFIVQVMIHNPDRKSYTKLIIWAYVIGSLAYLYMGEGSFAVANRISRVQDPQTIEDYFQWGQWQVHVIQGIYAIHLITALPQFVLIAKVRLFQALQFTQSQEGLNFSQIVFIFFQILIAYLLYVLNLKVSLILQLSGSIMSFFYVIIIPICIHLKCLYYDKSSGYIQDDPQHNKQIVQNSCQCDLRYSSKTIKNLQIVWIVITILTGTYITVFTLWQIFFGKK